MGSWEGLTRDEVAERYPDQYADWMAGRPVRGRGGEEPARRGRPGRWPRWPICPDAAVAVVVTHGGTAGRLLEACSGSAPSTAGVRPAGQLCLERAGVPGRRDGG